MDSSGIVRELKKVRGAIEYDSDSCLQVLLPTKEGKYLRVVSSESEELSDKGKPADYLYLDYFEGLKTTGTPEGDIVTLAKTLRPIDVMNRKETTPYAIVTPEAIFTISYEEMVDLLAHYRDSGDNETFTRKRAEAVLAFVEVTNY